MAFKDVRDLTEHLKVLGYTNIFPMSALYSSHGGPGSFKIVADILQWLTARLEPGTILPGGTDSETERVLLIRSASEFLVTKAGIKVNPRKLYASSAGAAKELLKITSLLINAPQNIKKVDDDIKSLMEIDLSDKIDDLRKIRELSSELTNRGATLYELLGKELVNKETRTFQANRPMELASVERSLKTAITALQSKLQSAKNYLENSKIEKNNIHTKLQRKIQELDRSKQRLAALQKVRPSYLEEFEKLEEELKSLFDVYIVRHRTVDALKMALSIRDKPLSPIASPLPRNVNDNSMTTLPEGLLDSDIGDDDDDRDDDELTQLKEEITKNDEGGTVTAAKKDDIINRRHSARLRVRTGAINRGERRVIGNMVGKSNHSEIDGLDSSLGSDETESELDMDHFGIDGDLHSDDESENITKLAREGAKTIRQDLSDEDF